VATKIPTDWLPCVLRGTTLHWADRNGHLPAVDECCVAVNECQVDLEDVIIDGWDGSLLLGMLARPPVDHEISS
jgi:hypothetical protein